MWIYQAASSWEVWPWMKYKRCRISLVFLDSWCFCNKRIARIKTIAAKLQINKFLRASMKIRMAMMDCFLKSIAMGIWSQSRHWIIWIKVILTIVVTGVIQNSPWNQGISKLLGKEVKSKKELRSCVFNQQATMRDTDLSRHLKEKVWRYQQ